MKALVMRWRTVGKNVTVPSLDGVKAKVGISAPSAAEHHADGLQESRYCATTNVQRFATTRTLSGRVTTTRTLSENTPTFRMLSKRLVAAVASTQATFRLLRSRVGSKAGSGVR